MGDHFENNKHPQEGETLSPEELQRKKELRGRISVLGKKARAYVPQNAELEQLIEPIKELIDRNELEKAEKALDQAEVRAKEIEDEKIRHPHEGAKEILFHQIGHDIAQMRERKTININDLANQSGIDAQRIKSIERGEVDDVTLNELYKMAQALGVDITVELKEHYNNS